MRFATRIIACLLLTLPLTATADNIRHIIFFGDSLSYNGSLNPVISYMLRIPDRFTNGDSWNTLLGESLRKRKIDYTNYALPGGTATFQTESYITAPAFLDTQIIEYLYQSTEQSRKESLIVIWAGFHDYVLQHARIHQGTYKSLAQETVLGIRNVILNLMTYGCRHFLVINLGDLSTTPFFLSLNKKHEVIKLITEHNYQLSKTISKLNQQYSADIKIYDVNTFFENIRQHKPEYGIKHTTQGCKTRHHTCTNPDAYFYWDHLHFTERIHSELEKSVEKYINKHWLAEG